MANRVPNFYETINFYQTNKHVCLFCYFFYQYKFLSFIKHLKNSK